jgi:uncharacterized membrane-anchored protein
MKRVYISISFIASVLIQLFVPAQMIYDQKGVLTRGTAYKFRTRPIDPTDPFRGKYITLNYEINSFKTNDRTWRYGEDAYVYVKDSSGYAQIDTVSKKKLNRPTDYVLAKATYLNSRKVKDSTQLKINFELPFDRFYMEEHKAKPAEDVLRQFRNDSVVNEVYGLVYIKSGQSVLKNVFVNDIPISEYVAEQEGLK